MSWTGWMALTAALAAGTLFGCGDRASSTPKAPFRGDRPLVDVGFGFERSVAADGNGFLIAYEYVAEDASFSEIRGLHVTPAGVIDREPFRISPDSSESGLPSHDRAPSVAATGEDALVVWDNFGGHFGLRQ